MGNFLALVTMYFLGDNSFAIFYLFLLDANVSLTSILKNNAIVCVEKIMIVNISNDVLERELIEIQIIFSILLIIQFKNV